MQGFANTAMRSRLAAGLWHLCRANFGLTPEISLVAKFDDFSTSWCRPVLIVVLLWNPPNMPESKSEHPDHAKPGKAPRE